MVVEFHDTENDCTVRGWLEPKSVGERCAESLQKYFFGL